MNDQPPSISSAPSAASDTPDGEEFHTLQNHHQEIMEETDTTALVVGHYCHDVIRLSNGTEAESLGGSVSYITSILTAMDLPCRVISKVGSDFKYHAKCAVHPPNIIPHSPTTSFYADFTANGGCDRVLTVTNLCENITPSDIRNADSKPYALGLAVGIAAEIDAETLRHMAEVARFIVADIQALIRTVDTANGTVGLRNLSETAFDEIVMDGKVAVLKASSLEAKFVDVEKVRKKACVIVTEGAGGCRVFQKDREFHVPAFPAHEVDPTGAGDSFLAGLCGGLMRGLCLEEAVRLGNFFGSVTVSQIGVPVFSPQHLQELQNLLERGGKLGNRSISFKPARCFVVDSLGNEPINGEIDMKSSGSEKSLTNGISMLPNFDSFHFSTLPVDNSLRTDTNPSHESH